MHRKIENINEASKLMEHVDDWGEQGRYTTFMFKNGGKFSILTDQVLSIEEYAAVVK